MWPRSPPATDGSIEAARSCCSARVAPGKSHLSAAFGHALIENGYRVLFTRTTDLVQRLQQARQALSLEGAIEKLDKYDPDRISKMLGTPMK